MQEWRRTVALSRIPITGSYRYRDVLQVLPAEATAPRPPALLNDHPFVLEYRFESADTDRKLPQGQVTPKWIVSNERSGYKQNELLLLMTTFTSGRLFQYSNKQAWFIPMGTQNMEPASKQVQWGQEGYYYDGSTAEIRSFSEVTSKEIERVDPQEYFNRYGWCIDRDFDLPANIDLMFDSYCSLSDEARHAFLSSCSLFDQDISMWANHPSLSFAALVSSLETLIAYNHRETAVEKCKCCGQDRYLVVKKFRDFFGRYGSDVPEFRKYAAKIYRHRSKLLHRGELFLGEVALRRFGTFDGSEDDMLRLNLVRTCRICVVNWRLSQRENAQQSHPVDREDAAADACHSAS
ncbi:MAG: hypothetical protein V3S24_18670 [Candidatus Tectomicrobia bacterium]